MFSYIILRDIPKQEVRIDLSIIQIKGGFRGIAQVPIPANWHYVSHYVSVLHRDVHVGFWCWVEPNSVVVKRFEDGVFVDEDEETAVQCTQLAQSGAMNHTLVAYLMTQLTQWLSLTKYLSRDLLSAYVA